MGTKRGAPRGVIYGHHMHPSGHPIFPPSVYPLLWQPDIWGFAYGCIWGYPLWLHYVPGTGPLGAQKGSKRGYLGTPLEGVRYPGIWGGAKDDPKRAIRVLEHRLFGTPGLGLGGPNGVILGYPISPDTDLQRVHIMAYLGGPKGAYILVPDGRIGPQIGPYLGGHLGPPFGPLICPYATKSPYLGVAQVVYRRATRARACYKGYYYWGLRRAVHMRGHMRPPSGGVPGGVHMDPYIHLYEAYNRPIYTPNTGYI